MPGIELRSGLDTGEKYDVVKLHELRRLYESGDYTEEECGNIIPLLARPTSSTTPRSSRLKGGLRNMPLEPSRCVKFRHCIAKHQFTTDLYKTYHPMLCAES